MLRLDFVLRQSVLEIGARVLDARQLFYQYDILCSQLELYFEHS